MIPLKQNIIVKHVLLEFLLLNIVIISVLLIKNTVFDPRLLTAGSNWNLLKLALLFNIVWAGIITVNRSPDYYLIDPLPAKVKNTLINVFAFIGITSFIAITFKINYFNRTSFLLPIGLFTLLHLFLFSLFFEYYKRRVRRQTGVGTLVVGVGENYHELLKFCQKIEEADYQLLGYVSNKEKKHMNQMSWYGGVDDLSDVLNEQDVSELFVTLSSLRRAEIKKVIQVADYHGVRVNLIPETSLYVSHNFKSYNVSGVPCLKYRQSPLDQVNNYIFKKAFDIAFALTALVILSPVFLLIALLIRLDSRGPILYTPMRKGEGGRLFKCYKFRSMSVCDDPLNGTKSTAKNDPRITRVGKYLRKLDLDELPQFFNVLKGDMSVVGPRPHRVHLKSDFRKIVNDYMVRHYVKPGITGWAQVNGWRGPTVTNKQKKSRIQHDLWYIENWNFLLDIKIVFLTVFGKKTRKNAF